jgi:hypothetical protein
MVRHDFRRAIAFSAIATAAFAFGIRAAAADDPKDVYEKYYEAIQVKTLCESSGAPDQATLEKLTAYIEQQSNFSMSAAESLKAMERARDDGSTLVKHKGCSDSASQQFIALYHTTQAALH